MKLHKSLILKIVAAVFIVFVAFNVLGILDVISVVNWDIRAGKRREMRLLCETNYEVLLAACRKLSKRVVEGELNADQYNVRLDPDPESLRFPQPILDLEPTYVILDSNGIITIELHGGFLHYGVIGYPEDYEKPRGYRYGDIKLITGLWYYNEDYEGSAEVRKRIDVLIEKGKDNQPQESEYDMLLPGT
jgi:hypothetical protein